MAEMMMKMLKSMKRALLLCLCLAMLAGSALAANEMMDISSDGYDSIGYAYTLPDGRLIFTGCHGEPGNYMDSRARILCLNPDRTVSWEYIHPAKGSWDFGGVVLMKDGTLCVRLSNTPYQQTVEEKLVFFTQDGQLTGREIPLEVKDKADTFVRYGICDFGIYTYCFSDDDAKTYTEYADWDGNVLFRLNGRGPIAVENRIQEEDGLVMFGSEPGRQAAAKILKMDWQGNTVWETTVPFMNEVNNGALLRYGMKTSDGGYLAMLLERPIDLSQKWTEALVKFSSTGRILWQKTESFDRLPASQFFSMTEYNGKYVVQFEDKERFGSLKMPIRFLWFDGDGNELGLTELKVRKEELPRQEKSKKPQFDGGSMFAMGNELWGDFWSENDNDNHEKRMASMDCLLMRIPEP